MQDGEKIATGVVLRREFKLKGLTKDLLKMQCQRTQSCFGVHIDDLKDLIGSNDVAVLKQTGIVFIVFKHLFLDLALYRGVVETLVEIIVFKSDGKWVQAAKLYTLFDEGIGRILCNKLGIEDLFFRTHNE